MVKKTSQKPDFSIITPSFNMLPYLRLCSKSIADQNADKEHIVIDNLSNDGSGEWLKSKPQIISLIAQDDGMYDAINKGISISKGEIISYLNCDEQYLPKILQSVKAFFSQHPEVDLLFGNTLLTKPNGELLAFRKSFVPKWQYIWGAYLYVQTSSMFVRRKVFDSGLLFDSKWKTIGDLDFVVQAIKNGFVPNHLDNYFSAFMLTGSNLGMSELALSELKAYREKAPWWLRRSLIITNLLIRLEKIIHKAYWEKFPLAYSVYTIEDPDKRTFFKVNSASPFYPH